MPYLITIITPTTVPSGQANLSNGASSSDLSQFWISFWANLTAGIISSILTGIIVGIIIWQLQKRTERKELLTTYESKILQFKSELKLILEKTLTNTIGSLESPQIPLEEVVVFISKYPVDIWKSTIDTDKLRPLWKHVEDFTESYSNFRRRAANLASPVRQIIQNFDGSSNEKVLYQNDFEPYYKGRLIGLSSSQVIQFFAFNTPEGNKLFEKMYETIHTTSGIVNIEEEYKSALIRLATSANNMKTQL